MKEELQLKLVEILTQLQAAVKTGADFAIAQLPDIVQQYLIFGRLFITFSLIVGISFLVGSYYLFRIALRESKKPYSQQSDEILISCWFGAGASVFAGGLTLLLNLQSFFLVWFAPKIWLLFEISRLIK